MIAQRTILLLLTFLFMGWTASAQTPSSTPKTAAMRPAWGEEPLPVGAIARLGSARMRHGGRIRCLTFSPEGDRLATGGEDAVVRLWSMYSGRQIGLCRTRSSAESLSFHPDSDPLAIATRDNFVFLSSGGRESQPYTHPASQGKDRRRWLGPVVYSPSGAFLAGADGNGGLLLWNSDWMVRGRREIHLTGECAEVEQILFSPNGQLLATREGKATVRLWDIGERKLRFTLAAKDQTISALVFSADGKYLLTGGGTREKTEDSSSAWKESAIRVWDVETGKQVRVLKHDSLCGGVASLALSPDGRTLAVSSAGEVSLWDVKAAKPGRTLARAAIGNETVEFLQFSPDGARLAGAIGNTVCLWHTASGRLYTPGPTEAIAAIAAAITAVAASPDHRLLAAGGENGRIDVWDLPARRLLRRLPGHEEAIDRLIFSLDGKTLASRSRSGVVRSWDADTGRRRKIPSAAAHPETVFDFLYVFAAGRFSLGGSPKGVRLTVAPGQAGLRILGRGRTRTPMQDTPLNDVRQFTLSPDGGYVLGEPAGNVFHVYEMASGQEVLLRKWPDHLKGGCLAFTADSRHIVSGMGDGTLLVWDVFASEGIRGGRPPALWNDLKDDLAEWAHRAVSGMIEAGDETVGFLDGKLKPTEGPKVEKLSRLIVELDSDQFLVRERAAKQLRKAGEAARIALEHARSDRPTLEVRRRIDALLAALDERAPDGFTHDPEMLRRLRSVTVLAHIDTPAARRVLRRLSDGADDSFTHEVKAALKRGTRVRLGSPDLPK